MAVAAGRKVLLLILNESHTECHSARRKPLDQKQQEEISANLQITVCKCPQYYEKQGTHENPTARNLSDFLKVEFVAEKVRERNAANKPD